MKLKFTNDKLNLEIVDCTDNELSQLKITLKQRITNWQFHPLVKAKRWDGYIDFMSKFNKIPSGLWNEVKLIAEEFGFEFELEGLDDYINSEFEKEKIVSWCDRIFVDSDIKPRDYQIDSAYKIIKYQRSVSEIATAAGKTLITYITNSYLKSEMGFKKFLVIVPNISLIEQTADKFEEYSEKLSIKWKCQMILSGSSKKIKPECDIIIGTYQSLCKLPKEFFAEIDCVCVDESHFAKVKSMKTIFDALNHVSIRYGLSGTSKVKKTRTAESFTIQSLLGPIINKIKAIDLSDRGYTTPVSIRVIEMDYLPDEDRRKLKALKKNQAFSRAKLLTLERKLAISNSIRNNFIIKTISKAKNNSLILFHNVKEGYGKFLFDEIQNEFADDDNFRVFYVDGDTPLSSREHIRREASKTEYISIIVASYGVFSTGIDIPNIFNIFLTESFKSEVIIKQTLGRGMRNFATKDVVLIFDFVDDFRFTGYTNYIYNHSLERIALYREENFKYKKIQKKLNI